MPPWLAELPSVPVEEEAELALDQSAEDEEAAVDEESPTEAAAEEVEPSNWLTRLSAPLAAEVALTEFDEGELTEEAPAVAELPADEVMAEPVSPESDEAEPPDWLAELGEDSTTEEDLVIPDWLLGAAAVTTAAETMGSPRFRDSEKIAKEPPAEPEILLETEPPEEQTPAALEAPAAVEETEMAGEMLAEAEEADTPPELADRETAAAAPVEETASTQVVKAEEAGLDQPVAASIIRPLEEPLEAEAKPAVSVSKSAEKKSPHGGLESSVSAEEDQNLRLAEATGVIAGLSTLLPAQEVTTGAVMAALTPRTVDGQKDAVLEAAREFQAIATQVPRPAVLPQGVRGREVEDLCCNRP